MEAIRLKHSAAEATSNATMCAMSQSEETSQEQTQQRLGFAHANRHPAMSQEEHFDHGNEVEEEAHAGQMDTYAPPALVFIEHGGKDSDTAGCIQNRRDL